MQVVSGTSVMTEDMFIYMFIYQVVITSFMAWLKFNKTQYDLV